MLASSKSPSARSFVSAADVHPTSSSKKLVFGIDAAELSSVSLSDAATVSQAAIAVSSASSPNSSSCFLLLSMVHALADGVFSGVPRVMSLPPVAQRVFYLLFVLSSLQYQWHHQHHFCCSGMP